MSPLWRKLRETVNYVIYILWKPSLTQQEHIKRISLAQVLCAYSHIKGRLLPAAMTVEAVVVMPLLLFFFLNLTSSMEMLRLHGNLAAVLWDRGKVLAVSSYVFGDNTEKSSNILTEWSGTLLTDWAVKESIVYKLGEEYLERSPLVHGKESLNLLESSYTEDGCIDIKLTYKVSPLFTVPGFSAFRMANRYYARAWTGYAVWEEEEDSQSDYVYVAVYGQVYHEKAVCSHLVRITKKVPLKKIGMIKNSRGIPYQLCQLCEGNESSKEVPDNVYITYEGVRYHYQEDCGTLKRTVRTMERAEARQKLQPCSKCVIQTER